MVITSEGEFPTIQAAIDFCRSLVDLAEMELKRAEDAHRILMGLGNTNLTIKTDDGECHIHTCRYDDDALAIVEHTKKAVERMRDRRTKSASSIILRVRKCHESIDAVLQNQKDK